MNLGMKRCLHVLLLAVSVLVVCSVCASAQTDDEVYALIAKAGESKDYPEAGFVAVLEKTDVAVEESGLAHYRRHNVTKILTEKGALEKAALRFDYDPASNVIDVESIRIFRKNGIIEPVDLSTLKDLFAPASMIYWGARMKLIGLPRLEPGDAVEVKTYKKGFEIAYLEEEETGAIAAGGAATSQEKAAAEDERYIPPMRGHFYDVVYFQDGYPIKEKRYDLHMPKDKPIQFRVYNGSLYSAQSYDSAKTHYAWWIYDVPALGEEPRMAEAPDIAPKLVLATLPSWNEKSRWFAAIHDTIYFDNESIRKLVKDLTAGLKTDVEKVVALQHWAAQEIRYSGLSMGKGEGYTHHPGKMSFRDRCGVCKDKAGMLVTLMRTAGYDVWPALTMAGSRVEEIPADQFNHSVVAWRHKDGTFTMLDPTWVPYSTELWSSAEQEQNYVIGTPEGEGLMETPYSPPESHVLKIVSKGAVDTDGTLAGSMKIAATNYMDQRMRRLLGTHKRDDLRAYLEGWFAAISPYVEVTKFSIGDPLDFKKQFALDVEYRVPRYAIETAGGLDFASPAWKLGFGTPPLLVAASVISSEKRQYPLFIWYTQTLECDETIAIPGALKPRELAKEDAKTGDYAAYTMERSCGGRTLKNSGKVLVKKRVIPVDAYPDFRDVLKKAGDYATQRVVLEREGGSR
jgi:hypothetical protein